MAVWKPFCVMLVWGSPQCRGERGTQTQARDHSWAFGAHWGWIYLIFVYSFESPLDCKEIKTVNPKGNQPWIFTVRAGAEAKALILWPPDAKSQLIRKDPDSGKDQRQERRTEDEMVGWHHQLNGHEFEHDLGDGEGQGSLVCCSPWGHKELDTTEWLNNNMYNNNNREGKETSIDHST